MIRICVVVGVGVGIAQEKIFCAQIKDENKDDQPRLIYHHESHYNHQHMSEFRAYKNNYGFELMRSEVRDSVSSCIILHILISLRCQNFMNDEMITADTKWVQSVGISNNHVQSYHDCYGFYYCSVWLFNLP